MTLVSMVGSLETYLDRILVGTFLGTADLATFHIGKTIGTQNRTIWNIAAHYVVPSLSKRLDMKRFPKELFAVLAVYIAAVAFLFLVIPWAIVLLYPKGYAESTVAARWFLVAAMLAGPAGLFQTYLQVTGRVWSMWTIHVIKVVVYLSSLVWLMGRFGVEGIFFAAVGAAIVQSLVGGTYLLFTDRGMSPRGRP
jgi:O-antigen/teichoic acid export membrane protein